MRRKIEALAEGERQKIRSLYRDHGVTPVNLAKRFCVAVGTIHYVLNGDSNRGGAAPRGAH